MSPKKYRPGIAVPTVLPFSFILAVGYERASKGSYMNIRPLPGYHVEGSALDRPGIRLRRRHFKIQIPGLTGQCRIPRGHGHRRPKFLELKVSTPDFSATGKEEPECEIDAGLWNVEHDVVLPPLRGASNGTGIHVVERQHLVIRSINAHPHL